MTNTQCFIGLGSNIETATSSRYDFLYSAVRQFAQLETIDVIKASHVYETEPVGYETQESFYNCVIEISTTLSPGDLLNVCLSVVEKRAGRIRTIKDGPRTLDVDILIYDGLTLNEPGLTIPHPKMNERAFVIVPLHEIAPDLVGDISGYQFVDSIDGIKKLDKNFDDIIKSYKEID
ncbi:MAG: 2-amino-4-hydroxy-6-hydroxymethyldihydropteridine diphosphokinase [Acidimicrobiia bacterium]